MYGEKAKQLIAKRPNQGRIRNPTCSAHAANPICGDQIELFLRIEDETVRQAGYLVSGCAGSVAGIAAVCELSLNSTVEEIRTIDENQLLDYLGGIPPAKRHGLDLALQVVRSSLEKLRV
jgi:nitrogen fixation NifU-like protein